MGENTMGVLDYANVHTIPLPCPGWGASVCNLTYKSFA
jgi:hypothetical protein